MQKKFNEVISYSQNIPEPKTKELFDKWRKQKDGIMQTFLQGQYMYKTPEKITFELGLAAKEERYTCFTEYTANLLDHAGGWDNPLIRYLQHIGVADFYANHLSNDYIISSRDNKKILKGTKIVKSFKYFISEEKLLHDLQNKASEIIQENKVEGYLVFSVHPLDFLSASENDFNWRSCHALDGDYRAGNLSYMCDSSTMMCYLCTDEVVKLPHFPETVPWNNKKWRMLLHFDKYLSAVFAGRQYPFTSPGALEKVREVFVNELAPKPHSIWLEDSMKWSRWHNDYIKSFTYEEHADQDEVFIEDDIYAVINSGIYDITKIVQDVADSRHFNDLLRSSYYTKPYYMFQKGWRVGGDLKFTLGAPIKCLRCGEKLISSYDTMMCPECECEYGDSDNEDYRRCDCCQTRFYCGDGHWVGDDFLCESCFNSQCFTCDCCGDSYFNEEKHWDEESKEFLCNYCHNERNDEEATIFDLPF